jgi:dTDP-glucose 4,6-dehydratase
LKNVLVTGGAGFIGSNLVHHLLRVEPDVRIINLDAMTYAASPRNLDGLPDPARHRLIQGDIGDRSLVEGLIRQERIDTIVHLAAETHVDRSIYGPSAFIQTNVVGTFTLLDSARQVWIEEGLISLSEARFHHVSTDEVYGTLEPDDPPFTEDHLYRPNSPYAASKAASDHLVRAYAQTYRLPTTLSNCSNNYGPRQFPEKLIPLMILNAVEGKPLPVYGDGRQIRDWIHVEDHCAALVTILRSGRAGETYNVGGGNQVVNLDLIRSLCALLDDALPHSRHRPHESLIAHVPDRPAHDRRYAMDIRKIERDLGWRPRESLESGLRKTVNWYLENAAWVAAVRGQPTYQEWLERNYAARGALP